jgi:hypothetical protein
MWELWNAYKILAKKLEWKYRRTWEDTNKIILKENRAEDVDWVNLAQDRVKRRALVNTVMDLWVA